MKRRREMEKGSELRSAIEELSMVVVKVKPGGDDHNDAVAHIPTQPFLFVCNLVIQVLDKIGPTMSALRQDMDQNIQRLEKMHESDPSVHSSMVEILKKEASEGNARKSTSCSRAFVWLTRFTLQSTGFHGGFVEIVSEGFWAEHGASGGRGIHNHSKTVAWMDFCNCIQSNKDNHSCFPCIVL
ncbi:glycolipid transfer protein 3-like isoform X3 [Camellia sinensis]|uniref:glycolipid transfer protein 3-like isoform X3 n=1 Tax=Camellia sinensis TaxID=4442 RepID=UPI001036D007|nr:glycolipid transfer protein 3-like isoform X3 [Camellia sinensis]